MRPSPVLQVLKFRHVRLTTKDVNKGFYKGNRTGPTGKHTKYGGYIIQFHKVRTYVVPKELKACQLTPFVSDMVEAFPPDYGKDPLGPRSPQRFLENWKQQNGVN